MRLFPESWVEPPPLCALMPVGWNPSVVGPNFQPIPSHPGVPCFKPAPMPRNPHLIRGRAFATFLHLRFWRSFSDVVNPTTSDKGKHQRENYVSSHHDGPSNTVFSPSRTDLQAKLCSGFDHHNELAIPKPTHIIRTIASNNPSTIPSIQPGFLSSTSLQAHCLPG